MPCALPQNRAGCSCCGRWRKRRYATPSTQTLLSICMIHSTGATNAYAECGRGAARAAACDRCHRQRVQPGIFGRPRRHLITRVRPRSHTSYATPVACARHWSTVLKLDGVWCALTSPIHHHRRCHNHHDHHLLLLLPLPTPLSDPGTTSTVQ